MAQSVHTQLFPAWVRVILSLVGLALLFVVMQIMTALSNPSQFVQATKCVTTGPGKTTDLQKLMPYDTYHFLYLVGPIVPADPALAKSLIFPTPKGSQTLAPATFSDPAGAVEVISENLPRYSGQDVDYTFSRPYHLLGYRAGQSQFRLFAMAPDQKALLGLVTGQGANWRSVLFIQGLILAAVVFSMFWLLNLIMLSNMVLQMTEFLIINVVFLVLFYSVLVLANYPLINTLGYTAAILGIANGIFIPLSLLIQRFTRPAA